MHRNQGTPEPECATFEPIAATNVKGGQRILIRFAKVCKLMLLAVAALWSTTRRIDGWTLAAALNSIVSAESLGKNTLHAKLVCRNETG
jgi:hypothetical protein